MYKPLGAKGLNRYTLLKKAYKKIAKAYKKRIILLKEVKTMKIELFYREPKSGSEYRGKESLIEFEARVNDFMTDKQVINIKIQGNEEQPFIVVMYNDNH